MYLVLLKGRLVFCVKRKPLVCRWMNCKWHTPHLCIEWLAQGHLPSWRVHTWQCSCPAGQRHRRHSRPYPGGSLDARSRCSVLCRRWACAPTCTPLFGVGEFQCAGSSAQWRGGQSAWPWTCWCTFATDSGQCCSGCCGCSLSVPEWRCHQWRSAAELECCCCSRRPSTAAPNWASICSASAWGHRPPPQCTAWRCSPLRSAPSPGEVSRSGGSHWVASQCPSCWRWSRGGSFGSDRCASLPADSDSSVQSAAEGSLFESPALLWVLCLLIWADSHELGWTAPIRWMICEMS